MENTITEQRYEELCTKGYRVSSRSNAMGCQRYYWAKGDLMLDDLFCSAQEAWIDASNYDACMESMQGSK